jgi:bacteriochlorophyll 4-vinyl reductase
MPSTHRAKRTAEKEGPPSITPLFPLLLLQTMRDMDRPDEVLEDEDLTISLPRRLGLSDVVGVQIRRFQEEVRQKRLQSASPVLDLMRLVIRRPDAAEIFEEAGRRVARHLWEQRSAAMRRSIRLMPSPVSRIAAQRAARRMFARLGGGRRVSVARWPAELKIQRPLTARADPGGAACAFYAGAFSELLTLYTGRRYRIQHPHCEVRGDPVCRWSVELRD